MPTATQWIQIIVAAAVATAGLGAALMGLTASLFNVHAAMIKHDPAARTPLVKTTDTLKRMRAGIREGLPTGLAFAAAFAILESPLLFPSEGFRVYIAVFLMIVGSQRFIVKRLWDLLLLLKNITDVLGVHVDVTRELIAAVDDMSSRHDPS